MRVRVKGAQVILSPGRGIPQVRGGVAEEVGPPLA
jgi:hypothetical protein